MSFILYVRDLPPIKANVPLRLQSEDLNYFGGVSIFTPGISNNLSRVTPDHRSGEVILNLGVAVVWIVEASSRTEENLLFAK